MPAALLFVGYGLYSRRAAAVPLACPVSVDTTLYSGTDYTNADPGCSILAGTTLKNATNLTNQAGGMLSNSGSVDNYGTLTNEAGGTITNSGRLLAFAGTLTNHGTIDSTNQIRSHSASLQTNTGTINAYDTVNGDPFGTFYDASLAVGGAGLVNDGTINTDDLVIDDSAELTNNGTVNGLVTLELASGIASSLVNNNGGLVDGSVNVAGGGLVTNASGATLRISGDLALETIVADDGYGTLIVHSSQLNNAGSLEIEAGATASIANMSSLLNDGSLSNDGLLENRGTLTNEVGGTITNNGLLFSRPQGTLINHGTIDSTNQIRLNSSSSSSTNTGTINAYDTVNGDPVGTATDASLYVGGVGLVNDGTINTDDLVIRPGAELTNNGTVSGLVTLESNFTPSATSLVNNSGGLVDGSLQVLGGGLVTNASGAMLRISGDLALETGYSPSDGYTGGYYVSSQLNNAGSLEIEAGATASIANMSSLLNDGSLLNSGNLTVESGAAITGVGQLTQTAGELVVDGDITQGSIAVDGGTISGTGTIHGDVDNTAGTVGPGNSPGVLTIDGAFDQDAGGTLQIELGGTTPGSEYDVLAVLGTATLAGTLDVDLIDLGTGLFAPTAGDTFDILSAETLLGEFDALALAALAVGLQWDVSYLADAFGSTDVVRLSVSAIPEPSTGVLVACGLLGIAARSRTRGRPVSSSRSGR